MYNENKKHEEVELPEMINKFSQLYWEKALKEKCFPVGFSG